MSYRVEYIINGEPIFAGITIESILSELQMHGALKVLSPTEYISDQQRRWWKGVLLPEVAKDSGESVAQWELRLKLAVLPDHFQPVAVMVGQSAFSTVPSINTLSMKQMNELIEGSVQQLHDWGFTWVTLPDASLRR
jgi:hypothetical protein